MPRTDKRASDRPIVAELGRPETPEETAARTAETSRLHRANQTTLNLVAALIVCLVVVLVLVLVVVRPNPAPREPVDFGAVAAEAQATVDEPLVSPDLPEGWTANSARLERSAGVTSWYIGFITPSDQFIAVRQGIDGNETWLATQLGHSRPAGSVTLDGVPWQLFDNRGARDDAGNLAYAMTAEHGDSMIVLFGTAPDHEFETLAGAVSAELQEGGQ